MHEDTIGILLSKRHWKNLGQYNGSVYQYIKKGEQLNINLVFFTIDHFSFQDQMVEAFEIYKESLIKKGKIKIPSIIYNTTNNTGKRIKKLLQKYKTIIINEHHVIKENRLCELLESYPNVKDYIENEVTPYKPEFTFYLLGQKSIFQTWIIPFLYVKDSNGHTSIFEENFFYVGEGVEYTGTQLREMGQKILELIKYYYPGVHEIGLQITYNQNRELKLKSVCSINHILKDLYDLKLELFEKTAQWSIELANETRIQTSEFDHILNEIEEEDHSSQVMSKDSRFTKGFKIQNDSLQINWIKLIVFEDEDLIMKFPKGIIKSAPIHPKVVQFGIFEKTCNFMSYEEPVFLKNNSFSYPLEVFVSSELVKRMQIPMDFVYQMKFETEKVMIGPTIGFLLGEKNHFYTPEYMEKYNDRFTEYEKFGGLVIAFSTRSVDWDRKMVYGFIYDPMNNCWKYGSAPIPSTLYRRNFHQSQKSINQLKELTNNNLFNSYHFKKSDLCLLQNDTRIKKHVPTTQLLLEYDQLVDFIAENQKVIVKPVSLSRGRGILIIESNQLIGEDGYTLNDYCDKVPVVHNINDSYQLKEMLNTLGVFKQEYLFQRYIPLLKVKDRPFDVRVVMQKYEYNKWKCTGIECRVAGEKQDLTNIARGGEAMTLFDVIYESKLALSYSQVYISILNLCYKFCVLMDKEQEHYGEFGLDIALDEAGYPWILEANIFPSFKGFKVMDYETYLKIRSQPLLYSVYLQGFKVVDQIRILEESDEQNLIHNSRTSN